MIKADKAYSRAATIPSFLKRPMSITEMSKQWDFILPHPDTKKRVNVFALSIYGSLSACWRAGEGSFIGCAQLLLAWFNSHY
ncbi:hypothetical protein Goari_022599 [Gossypium aridum]|uniref:Uncharacterized protein n=1 Tax=Gossypium aridum TaxID=34290 RepID=A0A7J8YMJ6_GOSAI|nr:hypothetical protein [Gossypium aridum]